MPNASAQQKAVIGKLISKRQMIKFLDFENSITVLKSRIAGLHGGTQRKSIVKLCEQT